MQLILLKFKDLGSFFAMINPKNNSENLKRNIIYKIITQPHPVVYIQCQQKSVKMSDKLHFLWQDKKANKVVKTHWTVFLFGVSNIWYQNNILKTFEKFWLHGSNSYSCGLPSHCFIFDIFLLIFANRKSIMRKSQH